ncbi:MAG: lamin tail domain-containing protein [Bacteroidia bacterium]|nr:lamin tail domain-containing protein [Bacteroidia bacterium]
MKKTLLSLSLITIALLGKAQNCSELFISEYVEGSGNSKAMEFYNPTLNTINLSNYRLVRYSNGSSTGSDSSNLVGSVNSYSTFVIANGVGVTSGTTSTSPACSPALQALAQQTDAAYPAPTFMNGDDALVLVKISPYARIDIFGKIGEQPATAWSDVAPYDGTLGKWWTKDHSLQRKATVKAGIMTNPAQFNVKLEWDSLPKDNWTKIGSHDCDCKPVGINENAKAVYLKLYPNPSNSSEIVFVSDNLIKEIKIINAIGQIVYSSLNNDKTVVLRNLNLTSGIYYTVVKNNVGTKTEKLIIQ